MTTFPALAEDRLCSHDLHHGTQPTVTTVLAHQFRPSGFHGNRHTYRQVDAHTHKVKRKI